MFKLIMLIITLIIAIFIFIYRHVIANTYRNIKARGGVVTLIKEHGDNLQAIADAKKAAKSA